MNTFEDLQPTRAVVAGDWHGNSLHAERAIRWAAEHHTNVILHVGDYGYKFDPKFMARQQRVLEEEDSVLAFVPGNHEWYDYLDKLEAEHGCTAIPLRPNIFYLPRNFRWTWNGTSFLALGGAHSVDRPWRRPGREWWARETITVEEAEQAIADGPADVMICHDIPAGVRVPCIEGNPHGFPQAEIYAADLHRARLREVVDAVQPRRLFAGHYHCRLTAMLDGDGYRTQVDILADDSAPLAENLTLLDLV
ncbi:metallophosphoesterase family protein [Nocardia brasiliensis]|uniref:metallophosphoesterase family protein n=1 Tax=Nocardia brasiliensis TaxID=37326 RepID=UPI002456F24D|nr:metallophosphoesterase [Nocardia brasiliensis]